MLEHSPEGDGAAAPDSLSGTIDALARARHRVLQQATDLLTVPKAVPFTEQFDALPTMSSLLLTSLEELKVAEEELRAQNSALIEQRAAVDERVHHYRQLFAHAPAPSLITDVYGTIQEANAAAARLFRRDAAHLEHTPVHELIAADAREEFRRQLSRLSIENGVSDWHMTVHRVGDLPAGVSAAVNLIPGVGKAGNGLLYWMLRILD